jgi:hypothetical protein
MALVGTIDDFGLADILQLIGLQRKTGILTLELGTDHVTVKFLDGAVVGADTSTRDLEDLLGSVLVRTGRITQAQLREALQIQKSTMQRLGYILAKQSFVSSADLEDALRIQVTQIVYRLFRWREGKYRFVPMDHIEYDNEHFQPLSAETILMEGARMIDEWPMLERRIKSQEMVLKKTAAGAALDVPIASLLDADIDFGFEDSEARDENNASEVRVSPEDRDILRLVDGRATVRNIVDTSALSEFDVYRHLVELLNRNLIEPVVVEFAVPDAARGRARLQWTSGALQALVIALACVGVLTLGRNPLAPWKLTARSSETELLRTYVGRNRLERVEQSIQAFYLDRGSMPQSLEVLASEGYLPEQDTVDPWGRRYIYRVGPSAYELGSRPDGVERAEEIVIRHPYSASQRMVLEGGLTERVRSIRP